VALKVVKGLTRTEGGGVRRLSSVPDRVGDGMGRWEGGWSLREGVDEVGWEVRDTRR
jgi:hypothetical protein